MPVGGPLNSKSIKTNWYSNHTLTSAKGDMQLVGFLRSELPLVFLFRVACPCLEKRTSRTSEAAGVGEHFLGNCTGHDTVLITPPWSRLLLQITVSLCANRNHIAKISSHTVFFNNFKSHIVSFGGVCQRCYPIDFVVNSRSPPGQICQAWKERGEPL